MKKVWLSIALFVHNLFGKITAADIAADAAEIEAGVNYVDAIKKDVQGITDPALLATAICKSVVANKALMPKSLQGMRFVSEAENLAAEISGLPLETIEAEMQKVLNAPAAVAL